MIFRDNHWNRDLVRDMSIPMACLARILEVGSLVYATKTPVMLPIPKMKKPFVISVRDIATNANQLMTVTELQENYYYSISGIMKPLFH